MNGQDYEESWDPVRLAVGFAILIFIICIITFCVMTVYAFDAQRSSRDTCMAYTNSFSTYLTAVATSNAQLCSESHDPLVCEAEVTQNVDICLEGTSLRQERACLFAATKDEKYCDANPIMCSVQSTGNEDLCRNLAEFAQKDCVATARFDAQLFRQNKEPLCHDKGWEQAITTTYPGFSQPFLLWFYDTFISFL